ncbi:twin-arginine translocation signal domain-containing protein [Pseudooceanicola sediminis]|uniref:Twin-arginine translocation signal domain-containing protein n=1 Tax=Pseudooceanicola sediminis TaxID=2211117 RepID=A0A399J6C8_9RHOB|nr:twin-arginine translocation signal domain-containing protein [Pseudooceanicola sediminis]KAA2316793.1 twin-arginine translocation signal domain-containing protein [Puniceibacterium sp. HSS470]RII40750.1 twin-arginine translocation signal domain-containing protein [Pseudooceanicola sediminis]|tara:strand:- start:227772 stop:228854 length:1083 start_codon:yes stop_codon:yes gene_type:complete
MDRRSFLKTSALGGSAAAATSLAAPARAQGQVKLTMVTTWPRGLAGVWDSVERFANSVNEMSDGQLIIEPKAAGELVGALEVFDAVTSGQADMYHGADYYFVGQHPAWAYFTTVPFGMTAPEMMTWYYANGGMALHHELGEIFGLKSFIAGQTAAQGGGWFRNPINSADDFKGLKFRMPGLGGQALAKLGASVQVLPGGEIYQALSTGALDGTEWIGPWSDEKLGLQEVCKNYYPAGFHEPGAALSVACNLEVFEGLTPSQQKIIEIAAGDAHQHNYALFIANNGPALARLKSSGVQVQEFPDDVWDAFGSASKEVLDGFMDDEIFAKIRESAEASMKSASGWMSVSDSFYTAQRNRVDG